MRDAAPVFWWRFLPAGAETPGVGDLVDASRAGLGPWSRTLRETRARRGAARAASLVRTAERQAGRRFGAPLRLLLVTSQQPRSLEDALHISFAIAGFALDIRAIEGVAALGEALEDADPATFAELDLTLVSLHARLGAEDASHAGTIAALAARIAERSLAPVALAHFAGGARTLPQGEAGPGVVPLAVPLGAEPAFDERFASSFGAILTSAAADRLADAAAGFAAKLKGSAPKLLVTDLDGTVWDGVLGEGAGPAAAAPAVHTAYAEALATLRHRGLVLAIASRNDPGDAARALEADLPLALGDFAARAIGWDDKASLVADVLRDLGLAPEHTVFIDDDPVNCAKVAAGFPGMDVRLFSGDPDAFAAGLLADPLLAGAGETGAERAEQYRRRAAVERMRSGTPDIAAFLKRLGTTVTVLPLDASLSPRAAELAARVNQFRFTGLRPNALALAGRNSRLDFMVRLDDAFGSHGLVGLVLASREGEAARIDNLLLSCRALERGVEAAMLHALARIAAREGRSRIVGRIDALPRNEPARDCLSRHGFVVHDDGGWAYDLGAGRKPDLAGSPPDGVTLNWGAYPDGSVS